MTPEPWQEDAKCRSGLYDPDMWFNESSKRDGVQARTYAAAICQQCPVQQRCLDLAMTHETGGRYHRHGIWGGLSPTARARLAKEGAA